MEPDSHTKTCSALASVANTYQPTPTLLPRPIARAISFATRSTGLAVRVSSLLGSYSLGAARFTTLSSLELARGMVEGVLTRAGRDVALRPQSDFAAANAETVLERSLENLHHAVSQIVFWTSASFQFTGTTLSAASDISQFLLSSLDHLFGSTDSSRAIASIVTLVRRELNNPPSGHSCEKIGVVDLVLALSALAFLQQRCRKSINRSYEEIIWDVVVLNDGERVDVQEEGPSGGGQHNTSGIVSRRQSDDSLSSHTNCPLEDDEQILARLKSQITSSLSPGTTVSISNEVSTVQTITVDIDGDHPVSLPTPPGAEIIETTRNNPATDLQPWHSHQGNSGSSYRVVYKIQRNKSRTTSFQHHNEGQPVILELKDDKSEPRKLREFDKANTQNKESSHGLPQSPSTITPEKAIGISADPKKSAQTSPQSMRPTLRKKQVSYNSGTKPSMLEEASTLSIQATENTANQKKVRAPLGKADSSNLAKAKQNSTEGKQLLTKKKADSPPQAKVNEKKGALKQAFRSGQSLSNMWNKESTSPESPGVSSKPKRQWKIASGSPNTDPPLKIKPPPEPRKAKQLEQRPPSTSRLYPDPDLLTRSSSRASYVSIHEHRRDSLVSHADTYSVLPTGELLPASPSLTRTEIATHETCSRPPSISSVPASPTRGYHHRRVKSHVPSLYSIANNDSQTSLILSSYYQKSAYNASDAISTLKRVGVVEGTFPTSPLLHNICRYMRFASASYGSHFLRVMGISNNMPGLRTWDATHHDVRHFLHHTESRQDNILLASLVDQGGGSDSSGRTDSGVPLVHYISLDHDAKAVVLACRGTLGFEDVLADLTCDYDRLTWRGRGYKVHKGIHASARRILYGGDGKVLITLQEALREFPEYGLVLCGHSLGAAVTALLGVMLSEPNPEGPGFVTVSQPHLLSDGTMNDAKFNGIGIPAGRPIHVFAYGPPGVMSISLSKITRGLITTVVHGNDLVPYLSLGTLHDVQSVARTFKKNENSTKAEIRQRMWSAFQHNVTSKLYVHSAPLLADEEEQWMMPALDALRASMKSEKLMPPGEVFCIESQRVLRRDAFLLADEEHIGRPAKRIVLKYVRDVPACFGEVKFGTSMLIDHSPAKYEEALQKLRLGVAD